MSEQIPSKASALIVTGLVKVQSTSCQVSILFSRTNSWHEFDEKKSKDVLDNKYSSCSISYVCKGVDVLFTKSTWNIFLHFVKTHCLDQMVFINVTGSRSLLAVKLCSCNFLSSTAKSSAASGSSSSVAPKEHDTEKKKPKRKETEMRNYSQCQDQKESLL